MNPIKSELDLELTAYLNCELYSLLLARILRSCTENSNLTKITKSEFVENEIVLWTKNGDDPVK